MSKPAHPMQPIALDEHGRPRFVGNPIVRYLLDNGGIDLNKIARQEFDNADQEHFAQLIGYSVSGYGELSYVSDVSYQRAEHIADFLTGCGICDECGQERVHADGCTYEPALSDEEVRIAIDGAIASELASAKRQSANNERRWREAAKRAQDECTRRQWLESELGKLREWLDKPEIRDSFYSGGSDSQGMIDTVDSILAGPPPKTEEPKDGAEC